MDFALDARQATARRAVDERMEGAVGNCRFGIPDDFARRVARAGRSSLYRQTIERGA